MRFDSWLVDPLHESVNDTQYMLLSLVEKNPGIRYRELLRMTGLANGVLTYHLHVLEKANKVRVERQSRITRYYSLNISDKESSILGFIRQGTNRHIVTFVLENDLCTFNEIVQHTRKSPSTVSHYLTRLKEAGIISIRHGEYHLYRIVEREAVLDILAKYKGSFVDKVVDNYTEMMEEL